MEESNIPPEARDDPAVLRRELERERGRFGRMQAFFQDIVDKLTEAVYVKDYAETPVYAVTADTNAPQTCAGCGFTDILFKPMTLAQLRDVVC